MARTIDLSTVEASGKRKWIYSIVSKGLWYRRRRWVAYALIIWLVALPWTQWNGRQTLLFDFYHRKFQIFGWTFFANESSVFLGFVLLFIASILILTALFGRVFCGWACPQTVFMEFVFRPIEQWLEGKGLSQKRWNEQEYSKKLPRKLIKYFLFFSVSMILSNTFIAYLFGSQHLIKMVQEGPLANASIFFGTLFVAILINFQFAWFREQVCAFVCPYGRLQSILLDRHSVIVAYDSKRGEPRGKLGQTTGDCIDCHKCVQVCPTGIDIREGLQLECIHCAQCIDTCDEVMTKIHKPIGLIGYNTQAALAQKPKVIFRPRLLIYGLVFFIGAFLMGTFGMARKSIEASLHREAGRNLFERVGDDEIINNFKINVQNRSENPQSLSWKLIEPQSAELILPEGNIVLNPEEKRSVQLLVKMKTKNFHSGDGSIPLRISVSVDSDNQVELKSKLFGYESDD